MYRNEVHAFSQAKLCGTFNVSLFVLFRSTTLATVRFSFARYGTLHVLLSLVSNNATFGGWQSASRKARRRLTTPLRLRFSREMVARPTGDKPMSCVKSLLYVKWSRQLSERGLYKEATRRVVGSIAS